MTYEKYLEEGIGSGLCRLLPKPESDHNLNFC